MKIAIVGLGLIGGSLARTIKLHTAHTVYAVDLDEETMKEAKAVGAYDEPLTDERLAECDITLVALYPQAIITWIRTHAAMFKPDSLVIDCGGVKEIIVNSLRTKTRSASWHFIGGHPMAGREFSGFRYTRDDMFDRASMILTPDEDEDPQIVRRAQEFFLEIGFRSVKMTTPRSHDEMIAYTSQLAHIVSSAYVRSPLSEKHRGFSAGSFADMTRVARMNEKMWTELFFDNRDALLTEVEGVIDRLIQYRDALRDSDRETMRSILKEGSDIKKRLTDS